jgi:hypothetical protein
VRLRLLSNAKAGVGEHYQRAGRLQLTGESQGKMAKQIGRRMTALKSWVNREGGREAARLAVECRGYQSFERKMTLRR